MREVSDLIRAFGAGASSQTQVFRIGTIPSTYSGTGRPTIQFDGESVVGSRTYPYLSCYTPQAGDRVLVALINGGQSGCILGKIV